MRVYLVPVILVALFTEGVIFGPVGVFFLDLIDDVVFAVGYDYR